MFTFLKSLFTKNQPQLPKHTSDEAHSLGFMAQRKSSRTFQESLDIYTSKYGYTHARDFIDGYDLARDEALFWS